jgi:predicted TIM-barrel fold metal-dependent hydrolase
VHLYPEKLFAAVRQWFASHSPWKLDYSTQLDDIVGFLRQAGVTRFLFFNYAHKPQISLSLNQWNYEIMQHYPEAIALGTVHAGDEDPLAVVNQCFQQYKFPGLKIHIEVQRFSPVDPRLFPVYEAVLAQGRFITMHVGTAPWANEFCGVAQFRPLLQRYPQLKIIVAHMGLFETAEFLALMDTYPNLYLDTTMAFGPAMQALNSTPWQPETIERYANRILFGSDFPNLPYDYEAERQGLLNLDLTREAYEQIFHRNAETLLASVPGY